jgi:hypothetical protein
MKLEKTNTITHDIYGEIDWKKAAGLFKTEEKGRAFLSSAFPSTKDVLNIVAAAGTIGFMFACPKAASQMLGNTAYKKWKVNKVFSNLLRQNNIEIQENPDGSQTVHITKQGMMRALTYKLDTMTLQPRRWDGKWRVVIFDIPEKHKRLRDVFRKRLVQLSMYLLQESVFVSPYPCFDEIEFLRSLYRVQFNVVYLLVEKIEGDERLRSYFDI